MVRVAIQAEPRSGLGLNESSGVWPDGGNQG